MRNDLVRLLSNHVRMVRRSDRPTWYAREWLAAKGLKQVDIVNGTSFNKGQVSDYIGGRRRWNQDVLDGFARVIGVSTADLLTAPGGDSAATPHAEVILGGYIGAGQRVFPLDESMAADDGLRPPAGYTKALAAKIKGNSMKPLEAGWLVFYEREHDGDPKIHINKLCAVGLEDGSRYIKKLMWKNNRFVLRSWNAETADIVDAKVKWASPIIEIRPC